MLGATHFRCFLILIVLYANPTSSQYISDVKRLIKDKELNYDKSVRPVTNQSMPITVYLSFDLLAILKVDEVQQTITLNALLGMQWVDEQMMWNPQDYGYIGQFTVDNDRFWTPTLALSNTNEKLDKIGESWLAVRYTATGNSYYYPGTILKVTCNLDIRFYPWDRHACNLSFSPWGYTATEYALRNLTNEVGLSFYYPNGAWNFIGSSIQAVAISDFSYYLVVLNIQRQPAYILVNIILPVIILSLLNLMIYFVPTESGERMSFSITLLLAIAVFLTIVGDNLPKSSSPMAVFSFYLLTVLVISNCITLSVIYSLCLYHRDEREPVGGCWKRLVRVMKCQCTSRKRNHKYRYRKNMKAPNLEQDPDSGSVCRGFDHSMNSNSLYHSRPFHLKTHLNLRNTSVFPPHSGIVSKGSYIPGTAENNAEQYENDTETDIKWKHVSVAFDRICFVLFLLVLIVAKCVTFGMIYTGLKDITV